MTSEPRTILITGASAGLGAALAHAYAAPGRTLVLIARRQPALNATADLCRAAGADVVTVTCDVRDRAALARILAAVDAAHPIDLAIVNAGMFSGRAPDEPRVDPASAGLPHPIEPPAAADHIVTVNLLGAMSTVDAVLPAMRRRRNGRIALIASLAGWQPLADAPAYSASKAGLIAYGEALRDRIATDRVHVSLVLPGHIATAQTEGHDGPLPLLMTAAAAARRIKAGLDAGRSTIAFPRRLAWLVRLGRFLPARLRTLALASQRFTVTPSPDHPASGPDSGPDAGPDRHGG